jgi:hypothetical protein
LSPEPPLEVVGLAAALLEVEVAKVVGRLGRVMLGMLMMGATLGSTLVTDEVVGTGAGATVVEEDKEDCCMTAGLGTTTFAAWDDGARATFGVEIEVEVEVEVGVDECVEEGVGVGVGVTVSLTVVLSMAVPTATASWVT